MAFTDQELQCVDCQASFTFTAGEAEFYQGKGLSAPKRCKPCRAAKKANIQNNGGYKPSGHGSDVRVDVEHHQEAPGESMDF